MRGPGLLALLLAAGALVLRRRATAQRQEQELWAAAGVTPDLR